MIEFNTPVEGCEYALQKKPGRLVEIGGGGGESSLKFLKLAEKYSQRLLVIDAWESGWDSMPKSYRYKESEFLLITDKYKDFLDTHKTSSLYASAEEACKGEICFAYVDGLQWKGAVLSDLRIVSHAYMICIDDNNRTEVSSAIDAYIKQTGRELIVKERYSFIL